MVAHRVYRDCVCPARALAVWASPLCLRMRCLSLFIVREIRAGGAAMRKFIHPNDLYRAVVLMVTEIAAGRQSLRRRSAGTRPAASCAAGSRSPLSQPSLTWRALPRDTLWAALAGNGRGPWLALSVARTAQHFRVSRAARGAELACGQAQAGAESSAPPKTSSKRRSVTSQELPVVNLQTTSDDQGVGGFCPYGPMLTRTRLPCSN